MSEYSRRTIISIDLGNLISGPARKRALEQIAEREGFTWNEQPSIGRWLISLAEQEIGTMNEKVETIEIRYSNDEHDMYGSNGAEGYDQAASAARFERMLTDALTDRYPGVVITVEPGAGQYRVNGGTDHEEYPAVENIVHQVWSSWDWLVDAE